MTRRNLIIMADSTIPPFYVYVLTRPNGDPFYVGKGTGDRIVEHEREARRGCDCRKCRVIRKIWRSGGQIQRSIIFETDDEAAALAQERAVIAFFGRENLVNHTDGGEGSVNLSEEARAKISAWASTRTYSEETRAKISAGLRGKKRDPKAVASTAAKLRGYQHTPGSRANMSRAQKGRMLSPEAWERIKAGVRKRVFSADAREKMRAGAKNRVWTSEQRAAASEERKHRPPPSPEARAKMSAARAAYWAKKRAKKDHQDE